MRITIVMVLACMGAPVAAQLPDSSIQFQTADGVTIFGELYRADRPADAPVILLFHQGGSDSRSEYGPIAPRLTAAGYHALAIDQRRGGERLGGVNRTLQALGRDPGSYCDALPDLQAALEYVDRLGFTGPRIAWGSSYSAALVFHLAASNPGTVDAILAFSPASGDPLAGCVADLVSGSLEIPGLVMRPAREMEISTVREQLARFETQGFQTHVADPGVHGASMLNADRVGASTEDAWAVVMDFLRRVAGS